MHEYTNKENFLEEQSYPSVLRLDGRSTTFTDQESNLLLMPNEQHDFNFTERVIRSGLADAKVVKLGNNRYVEYDNDSNLIALPFIYNSSIDNPDLQPDIIKSLALIYRYLGALERNKLYINPSYVVADLFVIDRDDSTVELVPPYLGQESPTLSKDIMNVLMEDILSKCNSERQRYDTRIMFRDVLSNV